MKIFSENILYGFLIFLIGTLASILFEKITKLFFKRISKRTKTNFDDFLFDSITNVIKPIGFLLTIYLTIDYYFENQITFISVLLNIDKLLILIILIKLINKILIRSLLESTRKLTDASIISMVSSLTPLIKAFTWTLGSIFYLIQ